MNGQDQEFNLSEAEMAANPHISKKNKKRKNNNNDRSRELERSIEFDD